MLEQKLHQLGLHKNEITIYLALFDHGKCRAGKLIETTKLHRNLVYTALESLIGRKLISKVESGRVATFEANQPNTLIEMVEEKKNIAESLAEELKKRQNETPRDIKVYEGVDGIVQARERSLTLPPGETMYVLGGSGLTSTPELDRHWVRFHKKRIQNQINGRMLFDRTVSQEYVAGRNSMPRTEAKYLPFNVDLPAMFDMFGDVLSITVPGEDPITFSLRSREAADSLKKYFEYLWNQNVITETGMEALEHGFYGMLNELAPGEEYYVIGAATNIYSDGERTNVINDFYDAFHRARIKKGVVVKMLAYQEYLERGRQRFEDCGDKEGKISFIRPFIAMPRTPMQINVFKNKTLIIFHGETPVVLSFDRSEMSSGFKAYFESMWDQDSYVLRGAEALKQLWLEGTATGEIRWIGARGYFMDRHPELFKEIETRSKATPGLVWRNLVSDDMRGHRITTYPWSQTKYTMPKSKNPNVIWLFGNKMLLTNWTEDEPVIFISENKYLVQSQNEYFEDLWNKK